jgi:hypothetical protein
MFRTFWVNGTAGARDSDGKPSPTGKPVKIRRGPATVKG